MTEVLDPRYWVEAESGLLVPDQPQIAERAVVYPGNDAWLQLEQQNPIPANAIVNPGFEADASGWTATTGATIARVTGEHHTGAAALSVTVASPLDAAGVYYQVAAAADQWWHGGVWVKAPAGLTLSLHIWAAHTDGRTNFTGTGDWQYVQADALVGAGDSTILMYVKTNGAVSGTFYVDDATFASPAWTQIETVPDTGGIPNKVVTSTVTPPALSTGQSVFGGSSLLVGGNGSALTTPDHDDWTFGAGDFTIEGRFWWAVARKCMFAHLDTGNIDHGWEWTMDVMASATPGFTFYASTAASPGTFDIQIDRAFTVTLNQWYHMAVVRAGTVIKTFVDGVQVGADYAIGTTAFRNGTAPLRILGDARTTGNDFNGYADELRISKVARWTSDFTVPTAPYTRDQYTVLLMHFDGSNGQQVYTDSSGVPPTPFDPGSDPAWMEVER